MEKKINLFVTILFILTFIGCGTIDLQTSTIEVIPDNISLEVGTYNDSDDDTTVDFPLRAYVFDADDMPISEVNIEISSNAAYGQSFVSGADRENVQFLKTDGETVCPSPCSVTTDKYGKYDFFVRIKHLDSILADIAFNVAVKTGTIGGVSAFSFTVE
ncbi:MAG: hypothetical protein ABIA04_06945 [Pseudomonadota bacterium]